MLRVGQQLSAKHKKIIPMLSKAVAKELRTLGFKKSKFFFFNDTPTTKIYTLSLHDALPIFLKSATPENTAEMATKRMPTASASSRAIVVFPVPGRPQRIIEASLPAATIRPIAPSGPVRCSWPTTSSSRAGRSPSASGAFSAVAAAADAPDDVAVVGTTFAEALDEGTDAGPAQRGVRRGDQRDRLAAVGAQP